MTGSLPPEWGQLNSLEHLHLSYNRLTGSLPPEWVQLASLEGLYLEVNQLTGSLPPEWVQLAANVQWLDLSDNQLTGCFPTIAAPYDSYIERNFPSCPPPVEQG